MKLRSKKYNAGIRNWPLATAAALLVLAGGCRRDMHVQPRYNPYDPSAFFADGQSARLPVPGTVARTAMSPDSDDDVIETGKFQGADAAAFPMPITREVLERGRQRFNIYCTPCHGLAGDGDGMLVQRGFQNVASYHTDRLRAAPPGHFFDVITNGFGKMFPFASQIPPRDRWAIAAYIRALQLTRTATLQDVPEAERQKLMSESK